MCNWLKNLGLYVLAVILATIAPVRNWLHLKLELRKKRRMNVAYPGYVWIRQVNERLLRIEEQVRNLDAGQGERVIDQRAEFQAQISAVKNDLATRLNKIEEFLNKL